MKIITCIIFLNMIMLADILNFVSRIGGYLTNFIKFYLQFSNVYSQINCYNKNYNFNEIFEYDNSIMLIWTVFGLNKHRKCIQRSSDTIIEYTKAN